MEKLIKYTTAELADKLGFQNVIKIQTKPGTQWKDAGSMELYLISLGNLGYEHRRTGAVTQYWMNQIIWDEFKMWVEVCITKDGFRSQVKRVTTKGVEVIWKNKRELTGPTDPYEPFEEGLYQALKIAIDEEIEKNN